MKKQFELVVKRFIFVLIIFFSFQQLFAQAQGAWIEKQLPDVLPTDKLYTAGENCVIYVGKNDSIIYTYDLTSGQWQEYHQPTTLPWKYIAAGEDVAIVATDSIITVYSAISQSFSSLNYEGKLLGLGGSSSLYHIGCSESVAYFITDKYFYVFDSQNSQWSTHPINDLEEINLDVKYIKPGYILAKISDISDNVKLIAFSTVSKKFFELNRPYKIGFEALDYGFVAWRSNFSTFENQFFGSYSAIHNTWTEHNENGEFYTVGVSARIKNLTPRTVYMFRVSTVIEQPDYNHTFYIYNTLYPEPCVVSRSTNDDYGLHTFSAGAQTAVISFRNKNDNNIEILAYQSETHSINPCIVSPLHVKQDVNWHSSGGEIYVGNDFDQVIGGYPNGQQMGFAPMPADYENNFKWERKIEPRDDWGIMLFEDKYADSAYIYSYNIASADTITHFNTKWGNYSGNYSLIKISDNKDVAGLLAVNPSGYTMFLYSPGLDEWTQKASGPDSPIGIYLGDDFLYYLEPNSNLLSIFNGATNQQLDLPYGRTSTDLYTRSGENFLIAYTTDNKYVSYSAITGNSSEFVIERSTLSGDQSICVGVTSYSIYSTGIWAYNALSDAFVYRTLADAYGSARTSVGEKTALVMMTKGYLFAFDPYKDGGTAIENVTGNVDLPKLYNLAQNYPNPFNPQTTIAFDLPENAHVTLDIFNTLGEQVTRLVDSELQAGKYRYIWQAQGLASGIYYYRLQTENYQSVKRMIFIK